MVQVIKIGDRTLDRALSDKALDDFRRVSEETPTVLVHGGGDTVTSIAEKLGIPQRFVISPEGFRSRYTDWETVQVYTMVITGRVNKDVVQRLQKNKIPAVGVSGLDGSFIKADRKRKLIIKDERGRRRAIDGGFTGRITSVDCSLLDTLLAKNFVPVVAPVATGGEFEPLNIDGDRAAAHIAGVLQAEQLLLMTDVDGVAFDNVLVPHLSPMEAKARLEKIGPGMITKVYAALEAISMGTGRVIIAPGKGDDPFSSALSGKSGTVIEA